MGVVRLVWAGPSAVYGEVILIYQGLVNGLEMGNI